MIYKKNKLKIDGFNISYLAKKYKTPIYCYSLKKIKDNIESLKRNFKKINPLICYAVKANTNLSILFMEPIGKKVQGISLVINHSGWLASGQVGCPDHKGIP